MEKVQRENRRLTAEAEKERTCRQLDLDKERERLRGVFQSELETELEGVVQEFEKIKADVLREKEDFQKRSDACRRTSNGRRGHCGRAGEGEVEPGRRAEPEKRGTGGGEARGGDPGKQEFLVGKRQFESNERVTAAQTDHREDDRQRGADERKLHTNEGQARGRAGASDGGTNAGEARVE